MADVAGVAAVQVSDPISVFVLVEANNGSFHSNSFLIQNRIPEPFSKNFVFPVNIFGLRR